MRKILYLVGVFIKVTSCYNIRVPELNGGATMLVVNSKNNEMDFGHASIFASPTDNICSIPGTVPFEIVSPTIPPIVTVPGSPSISPHTQTYAYISPFDISKPQAKIVCYEASSRNPHLIGEDEHSKKPENSEDPEESRSNKSTKPGVKPEKSKKDHSNSEDNDSEEDDQSTKKKTRPSKKHKKCRRRRRSRKPKTSVVHNPETGDEFPVGKVVKNIRELAETICPAYEKQIEKEVNQGKDHQHIGIGKPRSDKYGDADKTDFEDDDMVPPTHQRKSSKRVMRCKQKKIAFDDDEFDDKDFMNSSKSFFEDHFDQIPPLKHGNRAKCSERTSYRACLV